MRRTRNRSDGIGSQRGKRLACIEVEGAVPIMVTDSRPSQTSCVGGPGGSQQLQLCNNRYIAAVLAFAATAVRAVVIAPPLRRTELLPGRSGTSPFAVSGKMPRRNSLHPSQRLGSHPKRNSRGSVKSLSSNGLQNRGERPAQLRRTPGRAGAPPPENGPRLRSRASRRGRSWDPSLQEGMWP